MAMRLRGLIFAMVLVSMVLTGYAAITPEPASPGTPLPPGPAPDPVREAVRAMTLDEKLGQMVMAGVEGIEPGDDARSLVEDYHVGGFILMGRNVKNASQLLALINSLKRQNRDDAPPLLLSVDEEGGRVSRLPQKVKRLPAARDIGLTGNSDYAYEAGRMLGQQVGAFGYNMDFAPVLDINSNPRNPVIGDRAFGTIEPIVTSLGVQAMLGMKSSGVIPVVKHFPGHGDTAVDSHVGLPVVEHTLDRLLRFELIPFQKAIASGADAVMVAHILLQQIDPDNPASLSPAVVDGLLRDRLGFNGMIITDDMTMGAITSRQTIGEAAVKSVAAGVDIVLVCHGYENQVAVFQALKAAVASERISESRIDESVERILRLKQKYGLSDVERSAVDVRALNGATDALLQKYRKK